MSGQRSHARPAIGFLNGACGQTRRAGAPGAELKDRLMLPGIGKARCIRISVDRFFHLRPGLSTQCRPISIHCLRFFPRQSSLKPWRQAERRVLNASFPTDTSRPPGSGTINPKMNGSPSFKEKRQSAMPTGRKCACAQGIICCFPGTSDTVCWKQALPAYGWQYMEIYARPPTCLTTPDSGQGGREQTERIRPVRPHTRRHRQRRP